MLLHYYSGLTYYGNFFLVDLSKSQCILSRSLTIIVLSVVLVLSHRYYLWFWYFGSTVFLNGFSCSIMHHVRACGSETFLYFRMLIGNDFCLITFALNLNLHLINILLLLLHLFFLYMPLPIILSVSFINFLSHLCLLIR